MHTYYCSLQTVLTVSVKFLLLESACLSKEDSCNTVSYKEIINITTAMMSYIHNFSPSPCHG